MRYVKVLLLAILFFLALVFFFQNQNALSQNLVLTLNLFFLPPMTSIPLPFYFMVVAAFFMGAVLALGFLVWDKVNLSARLMKSKWRVSSLEREVEKLRKQLGAETSRSSFLRKLQGCPADAEKQSDKSKSAALTEDVLAPPNPDKA
ncbi:lipopolysaccharide assembly protein LapA domain-containing protein [uncultured Desulfovibrio sp.]|uniref:lipopolysaccharide assembly protein LapA domain-containing protein n=1 Tax=uncultured Desulfovibrio sp. TaxID=167968 RepID=UPI00262C3476|nr:lipopolysaccharide assembly protein LapA domain-containing protein [uncultured Desulfovibrio sp.]